MHTELAAKKSFSTTKKLDLQPIVPVSLTDHVEERLRVYFGQSGLKPGDAIPKEQELAQALQVSRNVVREALSRLRMLGIVDSKKRREMIICEPDVLSSIERSMEPALLGVQSLTQLFELRLVIEVGISDLFFLRKTKDDLLFLEKIVEAEDTEGRLSANAVKHDTDFHSTLYRITGNETMVRFGQMLLPVFEYAGKVTMGMDEQARTGPVSHRDLLSVLNNGTPDSFRNAMRRHLEPYYGQLARNGSL